MPLCNERSTHYCVNITWKNCGKSKGWAKSQVLVNSSLPKPGRKEQRPIGIPTIADRALQKTTAEVLNSIFEQDFLGFSFGGRPKVGAHNAICTLCDIFSKRKVNSAFEADLKNFFGSLNHEWVMKFLSHRVSDPRILNLVLRWLKAGVLEKSELSETSVGVPQGGPISVLISNIYLQCWMGRCKHKWRYIWSLAISDWFSVDIVW